MRAYKVRAYASGWFKRAINGGSSAEFTVTISPYTNNRLSRILDDFVRIVCRMFVRAILFNAKRPRARLTLFMTGCGLLGGCSRGPSPSHWRTDTTSVCTYICMYSHYPIAAGVLIRLGRSIFFPSFAVRSRFTILSSANNFFLENTALWVSLSDYVCRNEERERPAKEGKKEENKRTRTKMCRDRERTRKTTKKAEGMICIVSISTKKSK